MKKRILFMHQVSSIGGASYCLLNVLKTIDRTYFEPIVALKCDGPLRGEIERLGVDVFFFYDMSTIPYNQSIFKLTSLKSYCDVYWSMSSYANMLKELKVDIVYLNNMMLYPYLKCAKKMGLKTIIHIREHWPLDEHKQQLACARKYVYNYADQVVAINGYSASIFPQSTITIVYDWIDMESRYELRPFSDIFQEDSTSLKVYLYTGGMLNIKGTVQVIEAFTTSIMDPQARLLIVGVDPNIDTTTIKGKVKGLLSKLGYDTYEYAVKKRIHKDERIRCIPATYNLSHIMEQAYCNLSFFTIPHANLTLAECAIMGTPSIAARTEESIEYSLNEHISILYDIGDMASFVNAIATIDEKYDTLKNNLKDSAYIIKDMFSIAKNQAILNKMFSNFI